MTHSREKKILPKPKLYMQVTEGSTSQKLCNQLSKDINITEFFVHHQFLWTAIRCGKTNPVPSRKCFHLISIQIYSKNAAVHNSIKTDRKTFHWCESEDLQILNSCEQCTNSITLCYYQDIPCVSQIAHCSCLSHACSRKMFDQQKQV